MGMSTHIKAFKAPDEKWEKMKAIHDACMAAKMEPPREVSEFFNWERPDEAGVTIDIEREWPDAVIEYNAESEQGYEVILDQLPDDVTSIRVYNSY